MAIKIIIPLSIIFHFCIFSALSQDLSEALDFENLDGIIETTSKTIKSKGLNPKELAYNFALRGMALSELSKNEEAILDFNRSILLQPLYAEAYSARGLVYSRLKRYTEARKDQLKALNLNTNYAEAYSRLGSLEYNLGNKEDAFKNFKVALQLSSNSKVVNLMLGAYNIKNDDFQKGLNYLNKAVDQKYNDWRAHFWKGYAFNKMKKFDESINAFEIAIKFNPTEDWNSYYWRADSYYNLKNYAKAISDFDIVIKIYPKEVWYSYYWRGNSYFNLKNYQKAVMNYDSVVLLHPHDASTYFKRGLAYAGLENENELIKNMEKAYQLEPNNPNYSKAHSIIKTENVKSKTTFADLVVGFSSILMAMDNNSNENASGNSSDGESCSICYGSGYKNCFTCSGSGQIYTFSSGYLACSSCNGSGKIKCYH